MTTPSLQEMIDNTVAMMSSIIGQPLVLRKYGTAETSDEIVTALQGPNGGLAVEGVLDGEPIPVSGTVTATVDTSLLATQATLAAIQALATTPTIPTQITASDDTDTSTLTAKGLLVETAGDLAVRGTGAPSTTVTITVAAGQYVPIQCSRVMAASTAVVVGLS